MYIHIYIYMYISISTHVEKKNPQVLYMRTCALVVAYMQAK